MQIELDCARCRCPQAADPSSWAGDVLDQVREAGPWNTVGDGETFEDALFHALHSRGEIICPDCGKAVSVDEDSLGQLAMEMLACW